MLTFTNRLSAFVKSQDIVSASGPRLVIQDSYSNQAMGSTDDLLGTTGWRQQVVDFVTSPEARLITVRVMRVPGNPLIKGAFWLDDDSQPQFQRLRAITDSHGTVESVLGGYL